MDNLVDSPTAGHCGLIRSKSPLTQLQLATSPQPLAFGPWPTQQHGWHLKQILSAIGQSYFSKLKNDLGVKVSRQYNVNASICRSQRGGAHSHTCGYLSVNRHRHSISDESHPYLHTHTHTIICTHTFKYICKLQSNTCFSNRYCSTLFAYQATPSNIITYSRPTFEWEQ